jgi:hypothetical protein
VGQLKGVNNMYEELKNLNDRLSLYMGLLDEIQEKIKAAEQYPPYIAVLPDVIWERRRIILHQIRNLSELIGSWTLLNNF